MNHSSESKSRSLAKAISWRVAGTLATMCIVYYFTGQIDVAALVGGFELFAKVGLYYIHERIWARVPSFAEIKQTLKISH